MTVKSANAALPPQRENLCIHQKRHLPPDLVAHANTDVIKITACVGVFFLSPNECKSIRITHKPETMKLVQVIPLKRCLENMEIVTPIAFLKEMQPAFSACSHINYS